MARIGETIGKEVAEQISKQVSKESSKVASNTGRKLTEEVTEKSTKELNKIRKNMTNTKESSNKLLSTLNTKEHLALRSVRKSNIEQSKIYEANIKSAAHKAYGKLNGNVPLEDLVYEAQRQKSMGNISQINKGKIPKSMSAYNSKFANMSDRQFNKLEQKAMKINTSNAKKEAAATATEKVNSKTSSWKDNLVPIGVGGGLIFTMASRSGQMSNSELYGQQKPYGGY